MGSPGSLAYALGAMFLIPAIALLSAFAPPSRRELATFVRLRGLTPTTGNGPPLIAYLSRGARWRAVGGSAGWIIGGVFGLPGAYYFWGAAGFLLAALAFELRTSVRLAPDGPRRAELTVRRAGDYLSWGARWGPLLVVVALGCQLAGFLRWRAAETPHMDTARIVVAFTGVVVVMAVWWVSRWLIVTRPRPAVSRELLETDDAIRAGSLQTIGGASLALMCLASTDFMWNAMIELSAPEPFNWIMTTLALGMAGATLYSWFGLRTRRRRLRRAASSVIGSRPVTPP